MHPIFTCRLVLLSCALLLAFNTNLLAQCKPFIASETPGVCPGGSTKLLAMNTRSNQWTQRASLTSSRYDVAGFTIGLKGYFCGGADGFNGEILKEVWEYDQATDTWAQKADLTNTTTAAVGFAIGNKGYLGTGLVYNVGATKDFYEYDPVANTWTQKADFGGTIRYDAVGFAIGNKGYIGTGGDAGGSKDFWEYNPANNTWTQKADFGGTARWKAVGFAIGNKGYIGCGETEIDFWEYNPANNTWTQKANYGEPAANEATGFSIGASGYIGTGNYKTFWEYNPTANTWVKRADLPDWIPGATASRHASTGISIGSKGYIGLGKLTGGGGMEDLFEYTTASKYLWSTGDTTTSVTITAPGVYTLIVTTADGCIDSSKIEITSLSTGATVNAEKPAIAPGEPDQVFVSPPALTWVKKNDFGGPNRAGMVSFSIGNKGYMGTGGSAILVVDYKDFWEYDPATDTWAQKADFGGGERYNAVGFSIGNKGYVGTGRKGQPVIGRIPYNDFWEYDPLLNTWAKKADFGGIKREGAVGFSIAGKGYIGLGDSLRPGAIGIKLKDFWEYDPSGNVWTKKTDFGGSARSGASAFSIGAYGYVGCGFDGAHKTDFWEYNPASNNWTQKAAYTGFRRADAAGFSIGNKGYIGFGYSDQPVWPFVKDIYEYDRASNTWTALANMDTMRTTGTVFSIGAKGYMVTSVDTSGQVDYKHVVYQFTPPVTYNWSTGATDSIVLVTNPGIYTVTVTGPGCPQVYTVQIGNINAIPGIEDNKIQMYPVPATSFLNIRSEETILSVQVTDVNGRNVLAYDKETTQIDLSTLQRGTYFVNLVTAKGTVVKRIVKE